MSIITTSFLKIKKLIVIIIGLIRRAVCCFRRKTRRNSGSLLPVTISSGVNPSTSTDVSAPSPSVQRQFNQFSAHSTTASWQSWSINKNSFGNPQLSPISSNDNNSSCQHNIPDSPDDDGSEDFFKDMMPRIKRQKKVLLKQDEQDTSGDNYHPGSRLGMTMSTSGVEHSNPYSTGYNPTGHGDPGAQNTWDEESLDVESSLREARDAERNKRLAEHQNRMREKEKSKRSQSKNMIATKLS